MTAEYPAKHQPRVTAIMPVLNEETTLVSSLKSILDQDYEGEIDVVVAIGPSSDQTRALTLEFAQNHPNVTIVENPSGSTPAGLNAAIAASQGDVIVRCDGHSELPNNYIKLAVKILQDTGAANVGGIQRAIGVRLIQRAVAAAMSSPFGVGDARFHTGGSAGFVDTVYLGVFRRDALAAVGGYDESLTRNQDYELNYRLGEVGGVYFDPSLAVVYRPRSSIRALWTQYWQYGQWKRAVLRLHPKSAKWRQFVAPAFVIALVVSGALAVAGWTALGAIVPVTWLVASLGFTAYETVRRRDIAMLALPAVFAAMHLAWGTGFLLSRQGASKDP